MSDLPKCSLCHKTINSRKDLLIFYQSYDMSILSPLAAHKDCYNHDTHTEVPKYVVNEKYLFFGFYAIGLVLCVVVYYVLHIELFWRIVCMIIVLAAMIWASLLPYLEYESKY